MDRVLVEGWSLAAAAEAAGVSEWTASKWVDRFRREGEAGLEDRPSAPLSVPSRTPPEREGLIVQLRELRFTTPEIAETLGMPLSTVGAVVSRNGLGKLPRLVPDEPANSYQRPRPGELVHIDVKKLGRIGRSGHRVNGDRTTRTRGIGWEFVHVAVDVECPRFGGQLIAGLSGPAERLSGHATEAEVPEAVPAGVSP